MAVGAALGVRRIRIAGAEIAVLAGIYGAVTATTRQVVDRIARRLAPRAQLNGAQSGLAGAEGNAITVRNAVAVAPGQAANAVDTNVVGRTPLTVIARLALVDRLAFALIGRLVARALVALIGSGRAIARAAASATARRADFAGVAEGAVFAALTVVRRLRRADIVDLVADADIALVAGAATVAVAAAANAAAADIAGGAEQTVAA
jgi:hypothetical protein